MICHKCNEPLEEGDIPEQYPLNGSGRFWYFHRPCKKEWDEEQRQQAQRLNNIARLAGTVH